MKTFFTIVIAILFVEPNLKSQCLSADISYKYMYANQWDRAIQAYNFSRPFISKKQPLFMHGADASLSYFFKSKHKINHGIGLGYSFFRSKAKNDNFTNLLNLHFLDLSYLMRYDYKGTMKGFYSDFRVSLTTSALLRRINGEPFVVDDSKVKAYGIGGGINFKTGYYIQVKEKSILAPFVALGYTPYLYSPESEQVINQTSGLLINDWTGILTAQIGLAYHFKAQAKAEQKK